METEDRDPRAVRLPREMCPASTIAEAGMAVIEGTSRNTFVLHTDLPSPEHKLGFEQSPVSALEHTHNGSLNNKDADRGEGEWPG